MPSLSVEREPLLPVPQPRATPAPPTPTAQQPRIPPPRRPFARVTVLSARATQTTACGTLAAVEAQLCALPETVTAWVTFDGPPRGLAPFLARHGVPPLPTSPRTRLRRLSDGVTLTGDGVALTAGRRLAVSVLSDGTLRHAVRAVSRRRETGAARVVAGVAECLVGGFLHGVDEVAARLDELEEAVLSGARKQIVEDVWRVRRRVARLRTGAFGLRVVCEGLGDAALQRDVAAGGDALTGVREGAHSLLELLLAAQNNSMQETMQTLAVVTTMFVPLTFLAGIEGMNFVNQPELTWGWSYAGFWALVVVLVAAQLVFFRRKGWI